MVTLAPGKSVTWKVELRLFRARRLHGRQTPHPNSSNCAGRIPIRPQARLLNGCLGLTHCTSLTMEARKVILSLRANWSVAAICHGCFFAGLADDKLFFWKAYTP